MTYWTVEEDQFLIDNYLVLSCAQIGMHLGRSDKAVHNRAQLLRKRGVDIVTLTYLPGEVSVPCLYCGNIFIRVGRLRAKYCSNECKNASNRTGRDYRICPRCDVNLRVVRPDGRLRGWCKQCEAAQKVTYNSSPAGKQAQRKYQQKIKQNEKSHGVVRRRWSEQDLANLVQLYSAGMLLLDISINLNRTLSAITNKLPYVFEQGIARRK